MKPRTYWVLMSVQNWSSVKCGGITISPPKPGPSHWLPVFDTKQEAVDFNKGEKDGIFQLKEIVK